MRHIVMLLLVGSFSLVYCQQGLVTEKAMVVSAHPEASEVGKQVMLQGGNAIDAAIATQFALAVVFPVAGNIGGGGFMVIREADGKVASIDFREMAPGRSTRNMYLDSLGEVDRELITATALSAGVPGSVAGMWEAWVTYGSLGWKELLLPAVPLAANGFPITEEQAERFNKYQKAFTERNPGNNYLLKEDGWQKGDTLVQKDLAATLLRIAEQGPFDFYAGETARLIVAHMERTNGIISGEDLYYYEAVWREPVRFGYRDYQLISMPPPSSGGIALHQLLTMLEPFDLSAMGHHSVEYIHTISFAEQLVYADRSKWLGDPDFFEVPVSSLTDPVYLSERMSAFSPENAAKAEDIQPGEFTHFEHEETTHFSIVDPEGNAVAVTTTLNGGFGSKVFVDGAGFLLNNEMDDFSAKPGEPNLYGLVGGEANAILPGKRMLSSMTPTIVEKDGMLYMVTGTPGGSRIITSTMQSILNVVDHGMTMQESVSAPRFHHQWLPDEIQYEEDGINDKTLGQLKALGYELAPKQPFCRVDAILVLPDGRLEGGADPRGDDSAKGF